MMGYLDEADGAPGSSMTYDEHHGALDTTWVNRWKGLEARSRLYVRGSPQQAEDLNKLFTPPPHSSRC